MKSNYAHLILLDMVIYEMHREDYDAIQNVQNFWGKYSLNTIIEHMVALQPNVDNTEGNYSIDQLSSFSVDLLRTTIAYFMLHMDKADLGKVQISTSANEEELQATKEIFDFFQRVSESDTNS